MNTKPGAVCTPLARWKDRISNKSIDFCQIPAAARPRRSDSTKLVQNDPDSIHFGTVLALQPGLRRVEVAGSQIWKEKRYAWTATRFLKCCGLQGRPQESGVLFKCPRAHLALENQWNLLESVTPRHNQGCSRAALVVPRYHGFQRFGLIS